MKTDFISSPLLGRDVPLTEIAEWLKGGMMVREAAEKLGITRQRLSERFRRDMGLTAQELQRMVRQHKAAELARKPPKPKPPSPVNDATIVVHLTPEQKAKVLAIPDSAEKLRRWIDNLEPGNKPPELVQRATKRCRGLTNIWNVKVTRSQLAKTRTIDRFRSALRDWIDNELS